MYASAHYMNLITINQKLMCTIQFQAHLVCLNPPNGISSSKVEKQWRQSISLFQAILNRKRLRQVFAYPHSAIGFT
jgi:hypothetical protein